MPFSYHEGHVRDTLKIMNRVSLLLSVVKRWRRGWDSNPRAGYPTRRFRGAPVTTTSVPLRSRDCSRHDALLYGREAELGTCPALGVTPTPFPLSPRLEELLHQLSTFLLAHAGHDLEPMILAGQFM